MSLTVDLSLADARRIALAAQGLGQKRPAKPGRVEVLDVVRRLHALQLDTVNVLVRAHYLPVFSRLGPYLMGVLDSLVNEEHSLVEVRGAHQASFIPAEIEPAFRAMGAVARVRPGWRENIEARAPGLATVVERAVRERGPLTVSDIEDPGAGDRPARPLPKRKDGQNYAASSLLWRSPSDVKVVLDGLLGDGVLTLAGRRGFERLYDLHERVLPQTPLPSRGDALRQLVSLSARALGAATLKHITDYLQVSTSEARAAVQELLEGGLLYKAKVEGLTEWAFLDPQAKAPSHIDAAALIGPFDSLTWNRDRTKRLFGYEVSFEMYVPEAKRRYGYYVLPFLHRGRLVARVDLKADRKARALLVLGAFGEPGEEQGRIVEPLRVELETMARWLGLERVVAKGRGDLVRYLA